MSFGGTRRTCGPTGLPDVMIATPSQLAALDALCQHGTLKEAAAAMRVDRDRLATRIRRLRERNGDVTTVQLAHRRGWERACEQLRLWVDYPAA